MNKSINPNMHIKQNLNAEIEAWLAQGNAITTIQNSYEQRLKARPSHVVKFVSQEKTQKELKRLERIANQATEDQIHMFSTWLDEQKGRAKALVNVLGCAHSYISQIKSATRPCTKTRFEEIHQAMNIVEAREKYH
ncbi:hypothetical protein [Acinetobacter genomosp. 15BJ]|uniref:Uncharacterized protein n=1 Tax=Acinetobacter genomosp. 15BJ TaxID=106651 RepID=R9B1V9_9GAMM|nr:hypothetical protein [Acinetobacter genomosp. 15BJ]EOR08423.1 hypothetical protein F896_01721 [Acinetobacter genomosp. 15BJ]MCH7290540.1 hypothetical protein [Acinetobacter genomosp. 15BJ]MDO3657004.1 hypothetical protein [Acinetobacter genomosp. 15BJ]